jgi:carbonic anhydrase
MSGGIDDLIAGFGRFRREYFEGNPDLYRDLVTRGQSPRVAVVACADSRVDPAIVLQAQPGDIFAVRNVAALVPPCEEDSSYHGTSAALEFAVTGLGVRHVVVIGHAHCGGIAAMIRKQSGGKAGGRFIARWTALAAEAHDRAVAENPGVADAALQGACEHHAVRLSMENLMTFPFVREGVAAGTLFLHGWYLDIGEGVLEAWKPDEGRFVRLGEG